MTRVFRKVSFPSPTMHFASLGWGDSATTSRQVLRLAELEVIYGVIVIHGAAMTRVILLKF